MNLIELMVAVTIGLILIAGALTVFVESRATSRVNQQLARMLENGQFAMGEISRGLELAGYWGQNNSARTVLARIRRGDDTSPSGEGQIAPSTADAPNPQPPPTPADQSWPPSLGATLNCTQASGYQWYLDLERPIEGLDGAGFGTGATEANDASSYGNCIPDANYQAGTDILVVRYVDPDPVAALLANTVYVRADPTSASLFHGTTAPGVGGSTAANFLLLTYGYYAGTFLSAANDRIPTLRRVRLGTGPTLIDEAVIPGVENLQVQFGIDTNGDGSANLYRNADNVTVAQWDNVVAVRLWLIVRAIPDCDQFALGTSPYDQCMARGEKDFQDSQVHALPQVDLDLSDDTTLAAAVVAALRPYRRLRLTHTIQVRNRR